MTTIVCRVPSADKQIVARVSLTTSYQTVLEAPDFDVPSLPGDTNPRRIVPGMQELITPILFCNLTDDIVTIDVRILLEGGGTLTIASLFPVAERDVTLLPLQGQVLTKLDELSANGDRLQIKASSAASVVALITASEKEYADHIPEITP
jgi:hypothetical protein